MLHERKCVLLLEPDAWRSSGIAQYLTDRGVRVVGDSRPEHVLAHKSPSADPDVIMLSHDLLDSYGSQIVDRLRTTYPDAAILVHGQTDGVDVTASVLALGVHGYFCLSAPQSQLLKALEVLRDHRIWASREAVALMARPANSGSSSAAPLDLDEDVIVLKLLLEGLSNKEIAAHLGIAEVTVKAHLTRLYRRYGVRTRLQLLSCAIRKNVISAA
jgi:DNA-binding NarL/FixJ family response regulator